MAHRLLLGALVVAAAVLLMPGCSDSGGACGNGLCEAGENPDSCSADCGCGNNVINLNEQCDGTDVGAATCANQGQGAGSIACNADCTFDFASCTGATCGNGTLDPAEDCDGSLLGGGSCTGAGFDAGDVGCTDVCTYDYTGCCNDLCPDANATQCALDIIQTCEVQSNGCRNWENGTDCATVFGYCSDESGTPTCTCDDNCVEDTTRCDGSEIQRCTRLPSGCLDWTQQTDCSVTGGQTCAVGPEGPTCVANAAADDCSAPFPLQVGDNLVAWNATSLDYLPPTSFICGTTTTTQQGPDIVMSYTATTTGAIEFTIDKPANTRWVVSVSDGSCGNINPQLTCVTDYSPTSLFGDFQVTSGTTYYFYAADTNSGSSPLSNPLSVNLTEIDCGTFSATPSNLSPANASTTSTLLPSLSVDFDARIDKTTGTVTLTGNMGTNITYDVSMSPTELVWSNNDRTLTINPASAFPAGETLTVGWTLQDDKCGNAVSAPTWSFDIIVPPCSPGTGGIVGTGQTRLSTPLTSMTEYYVAADNEANGYVYVGGTTKLYRIPKAGGTIEDVSLVGSLTSTHLGYGMLISGNNMFTIDNTTLQTGRIYRISSDGGMTWMREDFVTFATNPLDDFRSAVEYKGKIYLMTHEGSTGSATQIWSFDATATAPTAGTLEGSFSGENNCSGLAVDDNYFYAGCYSTAQDRLVRVDRTSWSVTPITTMFDMNSIRNEVYADDTNNDGTADVLYVAGYWEEVYYVCSPAGGSTYADTLVNTGGSSSNYGLGWDSVANQLFTFDDDTREFIRIQ